MKRFSPDLYNQDASCKQAASAASSNQLLFEKKTLESEQKMYNYLDNLKKIRNFKFDFAHDLTYTNLVQMLD